MFFCCVVTLSIFVQYELFLKKTSQNMRYFADFFGGSTLFL